MTASSVCIFCEDIREEKTGQDTIVGTFLDNLNLAGAPPPTVIATAVLPKLGIYLRINLPSDRDQPKSVSARVLNANGDVITKTTWSLDTIEKAFQDTRANRLPVVGLLMKFVASPMPISAGRIVSIVTIDGVDQVAGTLNVVFPTTA